MLLLAWALALRCWRQASDSLVTCASTNVTRTRCRAYRVAAMGSGSSVDNYVQARDYYLDLWIWISPPRREYHWLDSSSYVNPCLGGLHCLSLDAGIQPKLPPVPPPMDHSCYVWDDEVRMWYVYV